MRSIARPTGRHQLPSSVSWLLYIMQNIRSGLALSPYHGSFNCAYDRIAGFPLLKPRNLTYMSEVTSAIRSAIRNSDL